LLAPLLALLKLANSLIQRNALKRLRATVLNAGNFRPIIILGKRTIQGIGRGLESGLRSLEAPINSFNGCSMKRFILSLLGLLAAASAGGTYGQSCSASNEAGETCSISCATGQSASCRNGTGGSAPVCECQGTPTDGNRFVLKTGGSKKTATNVNMTNVNMKMPTPPATSNRIERTNAVDALNAKLAALRDYHLSDSCHQEKTGEQNCRTHHMPCGRPGGPGGCEDLGTSCEPIMKTVCIPVFGKLKVGGPLEMETEPVAVVTPPNYSDIPIEFIGKDLNYLNCNTKDQTQTFTYSESVTVGEKVQMTKTVEDVSTSEVSAKVEYKPPGGGLGGEAGAKIGFSHKVSVGETKEQSFSDTKTLTETVPVNLPGTSVTHFEVVWRKIDAPIRFTGTVRLDAPLMANSEKIARVADVLKTPAEREVAFAGVVTSSALYGMSVKNNSRPATPADCKQGDTGTRFLGIR
jgi:hypothetical protein